mmetsp:Transcript_13826/g.28208  ORF Transcript_13826/g.28208 Transcript_13826/m.28208 type:complete len:191 (+) Transcript_13826:142-714(+)
MNVVNTNKICTSALLSLFGQGRKFWQKITTVIEAGVGPQVHGNTGKLRAFQPNDPSTIALHEHFKALMSMGEVRATQFIRDAINNTSLRDDDDDNVYLPSNDGTRPSYYQYCSSLGYKACPTATGNIKVTWLGSNNNQPKPAVISIHTYHRFWRLHYPNLKIQQNQPSLKQATPIKMMKPVSTPPKQKPI